MHFIVFKQIATPSALATSWATTSHVLLWSAGLVVDCFQGPKKAPFDHVGQGPGLTSGPRKRRAVAANPYRQRVCKITCTILLVHLCACGGGGGSDPGKLAKPPYQMVPKETLRIKHQGCRMPQLPHKAMQQADISRSADVGHTKRCRTVCTVPPFLIGDWRPGHPDFKVHRPRHAAYGATLGDGRKCWTRSDLNIDDHCPPCDPAGGCLTGRQQKPSDPREGGIP